MQDLSVKEIAQVQGGVTLDLFSNFDDYIYLDTRLSHEEFMLDGGMTVLVGEDDRNRPV